MRYVWIGILLWVVGGSAFAEGIPSSSTSFKGNVTLFDYSSPWAGLNNPALMGEYGGYPQPWVFRTASTNSPEWGLGRLYLFSTSFGIGVNTSFYQLMEAYLYYIAYSTDESFTIPLKRILDGIVPWTGGAFSTEMLAHPTNDFEYIKRALNLVLSNTTPGFYSRMSMSLFSFFLPVGKKTWLGVQPIFDLESYGSLTSSKSTFFFFKDPEVSLWLKGGVVSSFGIGRHTLPVVGEVLLGASVGVYPFMSRIRFESFDEIVSYMNTIETNREAIFQSENIRQGCGAGVDLGALKRLGDTWQIAVKVENLLSPILWRYTLSNSQGEQYAFDWILPNVVAGVRYTYPVEKPLKFLLNDPSLYCEVEDLLYTKPLALLSKVRIGADIKLFLDMVQVGVGLNQGYPTAGGKVNLTLSWIRDIPWMPGVVNVLLFPLTMGNLTGYVTYYGKELGHYPGHKDALGYIVGVEYYLEFGANGPSRKTPKVQAAAEKPANENSLVDPVFKGEEEVTTQIRR
ncbi:MAG: hypothetical protein N2314_00660 [Brevinematales bacterium]|nr:hypothetical protein [Brevinematales bacterium]